MSKITILGSASGVPVKNRTHSALLLETNGFSCLLDAGEGVSRSLVAFNVQASDIKKIFITHTHPDHCAGLPMLMQMMHLIKRTQHLDIHVPPNAVSLFDQIFKGMYIFKEKWSFPFEIHPLFEEYVFEKFTLRPFPTKHLLKLSELAKKHTVGVESFGFSMSMDNKKVVYPSDYSALEDIAPYVENADILIIESAHGSLEDIVKLSSEKNVKQLIVTHIPPELEGKDKQLFEFAKRYGINNVSWAHDGKQIEIK